MARLMMVLTAGLLFALHVEAQESTEPVEATEEAEPDCNGVYCKKVQGKLWIEGTAGPARFNLTKFRAFNLLDDEEGQLQPKVIVSGGEYGAGASIGAGVRVPVIKWISIAIGFDYSFIALYVTGDNYETFAVGGQIAGTFALTIHPI